MNNILAEIVALFERVFAAQTIHPNEQTFWLAETLTHLLNARRRSITPQERST